jgi:hypothetical protein
METTVCARSRIVPRALNYATDPSIYSGEK